MPAEAPTSLQLVVPADVRFFRPVRLAVGGLATLVGFDIEAIDDIRIGVDELCGALFESGNGGELHVTVTVAVGASIRVEGTCPSGDEELDAARFGFSQQILSVVADDFGIDTSGGAVRCWLERSLANWQADDDLS